MKSKQGMMELCDHERHEDWVKLEQTWKLRVQELRDLVGTYYDPSQFDPDDFESSSAYKHRLRDEIVRDHPEFTFNERFEILLDVTWRAEVEGADPFLLAEILKG